ncbi:MAG: GNAT family N-acetyltransferase [Christensenellaceae bacterium]|nr:GNAT family N-acetyltransferase [Christensenellaceae bacterium]
MEGFRIHRAGLKDMALLLDLREEMLRAANPQLPPDFDFGPIRANCRAYYQAALPAGEHIALVAFVSGEAAACGGLSLYSVLPNGENPNGKRGYIANIYTREAFRRRGLARAIMRELIAAGRELGAGRFALNASEMGRPLYESMGFAPMPDEMELH